MVNVALADLDSSRPPLTPLKVMVSSLAPAKVTVTCAMFGSDWPVFGVTGAGFDTPGLEFPAASFALTLKV
jgi:hypothetical protein